MRTTGCGGRRVPSNLFIKLLVISIFAALRNQVAMIPNSRPFVRQLLGGEYDNAPSSTIHSSTVNNGTISDQQQSFGVGPLIHVIQTRFMQSQPNLTELGLARVLLFETFCLPSLLRQSSQNFLWVIKTDPMLNDVVRQKLLALIQPHSHIYLIASNGNPISFRSNTYLDGIQQDQVWNGDYQRLLQTHRAAQTRIVLESRLDADDGLDYDFVRNIQIDAIQTLVRTNDDHNSSSNNNNSTRAIWKMWCADILINWQLVSPWKDFNPVSGVLSIVKPKICVTPGLTYGYGVNANKLDFSQLSHDLLHKTVPACTTGTVINETKGPATGSTNCLERFPKSKISAVRARTITSAGMSDVVLKSMDDDDRNRTDAKLHSIRLERLQQQQDKLWAVMIKQFGISNASDTRTILTSKVTAIASDNLQGQCIPGFTCKNSTRLKLELVAISEK